MLQSQCVDSCCCEYEMVACTNALIYHFHTLDQRKASAYISHIALVHEIYALYQCVYLIKPVRYTPISPVDLRLDLEKIRRKLILVSLESKFFIE